MFQSTSCSPEWQQIRKDIEFKSESNEIFLFSIITGDVAGAIIFNWGKFEQSQVSLTWVIMSLRGYFLDPSIEEAIHCFMEILKKKSLDGFKQKCSVMYDNWKKSIKGNILCMYKLNKLTKRMKKEEYSSIEGLLWIFVGITRGRKSNVWCWVV